MATNPKRTRTQTPRLVAVGSSDGDPNPPPPPEPESAGDGAPPDSPPPIAPADRGDESPAPTHLTEDERAYFWRAMDERRRATDDAQRAVDALTAARAAVDSYTRHLWEKYGLGDADSIDTETGAITRT